MSHTRFFSMNLILVLLACSNGTSFQSDLNETKDSGTAATGGSSDELEDSGPPATGGRLGGTAATGGSSDELEDSGPPATGGSPAGIGGSKTTIGGSNTTGGSAVVTPGGNTSTGGSASSTSGTTTCGTLQKNFGWENYPGLCPNYPTVTNCDDCIWVTNISKGGSGSFPMELECDPTNPKYMENDNGPVANPATANIIDNPGACASGLTLTQVVAIADATNSELAGIAGDPVSSYVDGCRIVGGYTTDFGPTGWVSYYWTPATTETPASCSMFTTGTYSTE